MSLLLPRRVFHRMLRNGSCKTQYNSGSGVAVEQLASKSIKEVISEPEGQRLAQVKKPFWTSMVMSWVRQKNSVSSVRMYHVPQHVRRKPLVRLREVSCGARNIEDISHRRAVICLLVLCQDATGSPVGLMEVVLSDE